MSSVPRKKLVLAIESALAIVIIVGVVMYFVNVLQKMPPVQFSPRVELLIPAGLLYLFAHFCWATFWVRLLHYEGVHVSWWIGLRTYYVSQFGKYIPGKVAVPLMRIGMLRYFGGHPVPVAVTAVYETLTSMAAGALLGVLFLPALGVLPPEISGRTTALFAVAALPIGLGVLNKYAARIAKKRRGPDARPLPAPSVFLLAQGLLHGACGYCLLALSLGLTIRALVPNPPELNAEAYAAELAAVALSYVAGFVIVVAPGGLGVREFVLVAALTPRFAGLVGPDVARRVRDVDSSAVGMAIVVALVVRLTWTIAEVALGLLLYAKKPALPPPVQHAEKPNE
ncbi:MAG: flippase-like domain-containing protein [Planctomycetia bacterium]|nr:flippase-like domain-containing protein [Planctomycetia bacterium]